MGFNDDFESLLNALGLGPDDYRARMKPTIDFESPEGNKFSAKWIGGPRSARIKLGIHSYPGVFGDVVDHMGSASWLYPITFFFDGKDTDKTSMAFSYHATREKGQWKIIHPVYGLLGLTLISITETQTPVEAGGITEFNTEWIEDIDPDTEQTARELAGIVDGLQDDLGLNALEQFIDTINTATATLERTISLTTMAINNGSKKALSPLAAVNDAIYSAQLATQRGIQSILSGAVLQTRALGAQIQDLMTYPSLASSDIDSRLDYYNSMQDELFDILPGGLNSQIPSTAPTLQEKNAALTTELALNALTQARSQIAITGPLRTRAHAIEIAQELLNQFDLINGRLEQVQDSQADDPIDERYTANKTAFGSASVLVSQTVKYLLRASYNLRIERRFTLDKWTAPRALAATEYNTASDDAYDLFIQSNNLKGNDILLLPPGREVVIYV